VSGQRNRGVGAKRWGPGCRSNGSLSFAREVLHTVKQGRETRTAEGSPPGSDAEISGVSRSPSLNEGSSSVVRAIQEVKSITRKELERREEAHLEAHHHPTHLDDVEEVNDDE